MSIIYTPEDDLQYWKGEVVSQKALISAMRIEIQALKAQRDELLAAAKRVVFYGPTLDDGMIALRAAIANAEKGII